MLKQLLWCHAVLYEELYGLSACSENLEYSLHMPEDIARHSTLDNYWCFVYERQVKYYKRQTTNMRSLCKTFADRAAQLQFVQVNLDTKFAHCQSGSSQFNMERITEKPVLLQSSSYETALELKEFLNEQELPADVKACLGSGIVLGKETFETLERRQLSDMAH